MTDETTGQAFENTMSDIRDYLMASDPPLQPGELTTFWTSLTDEERDEFKRTPLK